MSTSAATDCSTAFGIPVALLKRQWVTVKLFPASGVEAAYKGEGQGSTCEWEYNDEHERWDTECDDVIALHDGESPFEYGFKFCPYCGKKVREM